MDEKSISIPAGDGIDRRGFLKCMAWAGTGMAWAVSGGIPGCSPLKTDAGQEGKADFTFVQISDSHIGFNKAPNQDVIGTLKQAVAKINALSRPPAFVLHTGDLTHLAKPEEFDTVDQVLKEVKAGKVLYVPGEHDVFTDDGKRYLERYGK